MEFDTKALVFSLRKTNSFFRYKQDEFYRELGIGTTTDMKEIKEREQKYIEKLNQLLTHLDLKTSIYEKGNINFNPIQVEHQTEHQVENHILFHKRLTP